MTTMTTTTAEPLLLTVPESAKLLNISRVTVFKLLRSGRLASLKIGAKRMIPRQELDRFIERETATKDSAEATL